MPVKKLSVIISVCKEKQHLCENYLFQFVFDVLPTGRNLQMHCIFRFFVAGQV